MVWPTKYGTAASQGSTPPEPPDRSDATAVDSIRHYQAASNYNANLNLLPPNWATAPRRDLSAEFLLNRVPGQEGTVFPGSTSVGNRQEALLQVYWPTSTAKGKENFIDLLQIESRPIGATNWRSSITTIYWEVGTNPNQEGEAFLFAGVPTDEYRASAIYRFSPEPVYSRIESVDTATTSLGQYENGEVHLHNVGAVRETIAAYSFSTVIIPVVEEERMVPHDHNTDAGVRTINFYGYFADRAPRETGDRFIPAAHSANGNTTSSLAYAQFLS